jgi:MFS family permease
MAWNEQDNKTSEGGVGRARAWLRGGPWRALRSRDFRLLWLGQLVSVTGSQMRIVAIAWQVYLVKQDPLQLGILGLTQAVALIIFSLVAGVVADAFDRRQLLIVVNATLACGSLTLALATQFHVISLPLIYAVAFLMAAVSAFDYPARQALIPSLVTAAELPDALAINSLVFNLASIVGPTLGGLAIAIAGVTGAYGADASSFLVVTAALVAMRGVKVRGTGAKRGNPVSAWLDGFAYLRGRPVLLGLMALDFCAMFFGSPQALLPIYARDIFHGGPAALGILSSAGAVGAVAGVFFVARLRGIRRQGLGVLLGVAAWGLCIVLFGLTNGPLWPGQPWQTLSWQGPFWLAFVFLAGAGASDLVSMVLRNVILQLSTPDEMRGRVSATNAIFIIGGPSLGQFESGVVARFLTPQLSALTGGLACLAATGLIAWRVPAVRRYHAGMYGAPNGAQPAPVLDEAIADPAVSAAAELTSAE